MQKRYGDNVEVFLEKSDNIMIRLDHFVVHIDQDQTKLEFLKDKIAPIGFPFNPTSGKRTKGFQVANIWIGDRYLELILMVPHRCGMGVSHGRTNSLPSSVVKLASWLANGWRYFNNSIAFLSKDESTEAFSELRGCSKSGYF